MHGVAFLSTSLVCVQLIGINNMDNWATSLYSWLKSVPETLGLSQPASPAEPHVVDVKSESSPQDLGSWLDWSSISFNEYPGVPSTAVILAASAVLVGCCLWQHTIGFSWKPATKFLQFVRRHLSSEANTDSALKELSQLQDLISEQLRQQTTNWAAASQYQQRLEKTISGLLRKQRNSFAKSLKATRRRKRIVFRKHRLRQKLFECLDDKEAQTESTDSAAATDKISDIPEEELKKLRSSLVNFILGEAAASPVDGRGESPLRPTSSQICNMKKSTTSLAQPDETKTRRKKKMASRSPATISNLERFRICEDSPRSVTFRTPPEHHTPKGREDATPIFQDLNYSNNAETSRSAASQAVHKTRSQPKVYRYIKRRKKNSARPVVEPSTSTIDTEPTELLETVTSPTLSCNERPKLVCLESPWSTTPSEQRKQIERIGTSSSFRDVNYVSSQNVLIPTRKLVKIFVRNSEMTSSEIKTAIFKQYNLAKKQENWYYIKKLREDTRVVVTGEWIDKYLTLPSTKVRSEKTEARHSSKSLEKIFGDHFSNERHVSIPRVASTPSVFLDTPKRKGTLSSFSTMALNLSDNRDLQYSPQLGLKQLVPRQQYDPCQFNVDTPSTMKCHSGTSAPYSHDSCRDAEQKREYFSSLPIMAREHVGDEAFENNLVQPRRSLSGSHMVELELPRDFAARRKSFYKNYKRPTAQTLSMSRAVFNL